MRIRSLLLMALMATAAIPAIAEDAKPMSKKAIAVKVAKIAGYTAEVVVPIFGHLYFIICENLKQYIPDHKENSSLFFMDGLVLTAIGNGVYGLQKELKPVFKCLVDKFKNRKNRKVETA